MSASTVSGTIQDPSGQIFANGTWQLIFKPAPNTPGTFTDGGVPFTKLFGGVLDATGSFSQAGVARSDTIAPIGSRWTLVVSPNANGQAYSVDLNVNSGAFNASAAINAVITNIVVQATTVAHAYKDAEVIPIPGSGGLYFDVTNKVLKLWDIVGQVWLTVPVGILPISIAAVASNWLRSYDSTTGLFTASQPTEADITNLVADLTSIAIALALLAPISNPTFIGTVKMPSITQIAATVFAITDNQGGTRFSIPSGGITQSTLNNTAIGGGSSFSGTISASRITPRQVVMADATGVTPTSDTADINTFVSTQAGGTLTVNAPSGTPTDGQKLILRLKSTNAQTYSFNATYAFSTTVTAPITLAAGKTDYIGLIWNATNTKWDVVAVDQGH